MDAAELAADRFRKGFVLVLTAATSVAFLATIRDFLMALLLAAVVAGICRPLHRMLATLLRGRESLSAFVTVLLVVVVVVGPSRPSSAWSRVRPSRSATASSRG